MDLRGWGWEWREAWGGVWIQEDWEVSKIEGCGWPSSAFENYPIEVFRSIVYLT